MIDVSLLKKDINRIKEEYKKRFITKPNLENVLDLNKKRRQLTEQVDKLRAEQAQLSAKIPKASAQEKKKLIAAGRDYAKKLKVLEPQQKALETEFKILAAHLPNFADQSVPIGKSAKDNKVVSLIGEKPIFDFPIKPHWQLAEALGLLDSKKGAQVSGSRFHYLKGDLVRLQFALLQFALNELTQKGYLPMLTPTLVKKKAMFGSGMFPVDQQEVYALPHDKLYLIATSEITLLNYHAGETIDLSEPIKYAGYTTNYRREAGTYGKDMHGLIRQHQFDKLEMFIFADQDQSWDFFEKELVATAENLLKKLGLHFRKVVIASGDLARKYHKSYDLEVWLPSEQRYLETHSISHAGDYQARRLGIKYVDAQGHRRYAHTLNGTAYAFSRMPVVIMENFQEADGRIRIPEVLQPFMNNQEYIG